LSEKCILILGGARSGKSQFAQDYAGELSDDVLYVATAEVGDEEMRERIEAHRISRPQSWRTVEASVEVGKKIRNRIGKSAVVIIDCITLLVSNVLVRYEEDPHLEQRIQSEIEDLININKESNTVFLIVSNEVGLGLVPDNRLGRLYRDFLGRVNQMLAQHADEVYFMVAGIPLRIKG